MRSLDVTELAPTKGYKRITRKEFLAVTGGREHDRESHFSWGAVCQWLINGWVMEEHQPDVGEVRWFWCVGDEA